jgi:hypothetical protein
VYNSTGLSSTSCEKIRKFVLDNNDPMRAFLTRAHSYEEIVPLLITFCFTLEEMQPEKEMNLNYAELLTLWLKGIGIQEIVSHFSDDIKSTDIAEFIEDFFAYRLPWGVAAIIQIASKVLSLEKRDLSDVGKFLPSMIKYGVPTPIASWAISAGIPFRDVGIKVSENYQSVKNGKHDYDEFLSYVTSLGPEDLNRDFKLVSPYLEEVSKALAKASGNSFLSNYKREGFYPVETWVAGVKYGRAAIAASARVDDKIELLREYENAVDRNAIMVRLKGQEIGYIERNLAQRIAPDLDVGMKITGKIIDIEQREIPNIKLVLNALWEV